MTKKDFVVFVDTNGVTRAEVDPHDGKGFMHLIHAEGTIIGFVSAECEADAISYGETVLRKD